jgi:class 3 adenylate cyclase/predicted ATPase
MDLGGWLRSLGLERYEAAFREHEIDETILPNLTAEDLNDLGVRLVGHRVKLLAAIAALRADANAQAPSPDALPAIDRSQDTAERRQVTVMILDLVGSTELSTRMDPEDLSEVLSAYQKCVTDTVREFGGYVARYLGDGVLVYFGYPQAHEDDAAQAVRAGLKLIKGVVALKTCASLQTRVGIATGLVVVGHLIGSGEARLSDIVGETPNLAARLQGIAEPSTVVIAEGTQKLLGDLFELSDLGAQDLRGIAGPVRAWAAVKERSVDRFAAQHASGMTALVGRKEEFAWLRRRWARAKAGEGQVVLLSGDAGIGKSRLTAALLERLADEPHTRLRYFCSPQHAYSALYPIIGQMERAAGLVLDDSPRAKLDKLDAVLGQTSTSIQDAGLLAEMLSLPNDGRYPVLDLPPQQRRQGLMRALISQVRALTGQRPLLMIFEDAHWADPTSLELFGRVVGEIASRRGLLILTFRPGPKFEPPWIGQPHVTTLTLNRLAPSEVGAMIDHIIGNQPLPASIRQDIIERTDGVPLFVEEMTKAVLEAEGEGEARRTAALVPSPALAVPEILHASLMPRLDRLGPAAKELAQIGAAIGREFSGALLAAVACKPEAELRSALDRLIEAGLLFPQGETYLFKHALVRDVAYSLLLREQRRALHKRIAETFESQFKEIAENRPELVARHYTDAGQIEKAAGLWGIAGQQSAQRSALIEAAEQLSRALRQIATLPATPARRQEEIEFQVALITPLQHVSGYAAPKTRAAVERARLLIEQAEALGEPPEDPLLLFSVLYALWAANIVAFDGDVMRQLGVQFLARAEKQKATGPLAIGHRLMGLSLLNTGDIAGGRAHLDCAVALYDSAEHLPLATRFGQDVGAASLSWKALALWLLGYPEAALADTEHALKVARKTGHSATVMYVLNFCASTHIHCGNYAAANALVDEFIPLMDQTGSSFWGAWGMVQRGCLLALTGKDADAVQTIASGVTAMRSSGTTMWMPMWLSYLTRAKAEIGQFDDVMRCIGEAMTAVETTKERWYEAEVNRIAGEIAMLLPEPDVAKAEAYFEHAFAVARKQQARSWELRAAMSMARLWHDQGRRQQARDLLAPVYGWFTEGFDTLDLKEAKALLDALAS